MEFPKTFDRMITCGSTECMGQRRKELWKKRYNATRNNLQKREMQRGWDHR